MVHKVLGCIVHPVRLCGVVLFGGRELLVVGSFSHFGIRASFRVWGLGFLGLPPERSRRLLFFFNFLFLVILLLLGAFSSESSVL